MQSKRKQQSLGVTAILISTIFYGLMGVYSKIIGVNFGIFTQSYIRNLIVFLIIFVLCLVLRKKWVKIQKQDIPWIILWSISGTIASVCFFVAVNYLSIGTTVIIFFAGSNISGYLAGKVLYQEQLTKSKIIASILSILGVLLVYYSTIGLDNLVFSIMALFSGLGTGLWNTVSKKFSHHYSGLQITGMDAFASFLMTLFASMIVFEPLPTISDHRVLHRLRI
ncbi:MAG: DMT family permease [candidate division CPR3 bacterium GW2011_GWE2_35_7]|nr:MAG: DMT family permease [candidate division CPR3 bacterium GW2011_GWE2_35_7]